MIVGTAPSCQSLYAQPFLREIKGSAPSRCFFGAHRKRDAADPLSRKSRAQPHVSSRDMGTPTLPSHTRDEIAEAVGVSAGEVSSVSSRMADVPNLTKFSQAAAEHATDFEPLAAPCVRRYTNHASSRWRLSPRFWVGPRVSKPGGLLAKLPTQRGPAGNAQSVHSFVLCAPRPCPQRKTLHTACTRHPVTYCLREKIGTVHHRGNG